MPDRPRHVLPVIVFAQFAGTSLWFAGNAVAAGLAQAHGLGAGAVGPLTWSVQLGFIGGTLGLAASNLADRWSARHLFAVSAALGAATTAAMTAPGLSFSALLGLRALTGAALAGVYPVGMKIAASWYAEGLGRALGWLVGALVVGTAFPHLLVALGAELDWRPVLLTVAGLAVLGGAALWLGVPDGPHLPRAARFNPRALRAVMGVPAFRAAAFGYFGHMWELYAAWALVPALLAAGPPLPGPVSAWAFAAIGAGGLGCVLGGWASRRWGSRRVARVALAGSGLVAASAPLLPALPPAAFAAAVITWGVALAADSPQFSALCAAAAPAARVGSALTLVTSLGFALTIPAIELSARLAAAVGPEWAVLALAPGPALGLWATRRRLSP